MKVAIDIRRIRKFGAGTYTRNLVETLARLDIGGENSYLLCGAEEDAAELPGLPDRIELMILRHRDGLRADLELTWGLQRARVDLFHATYLYAPWVLPERYVITVHDTVNFLTRNGATVFDLARFYRTRQNLNRATRIHAVSTATQRDLTALFGIPQSKIEVIYNGLDQRLKKPATAKLAKTILERYSIADPYVLYVGNARPHKNLPRLIEAFALVKDELRDHDTFSGLKLLILGDELGEHPELRHAVVRSRCQGEVRFLGYVPAEQLRVFYASAAVFAFPSLHEGFGLPPLEAMAQGTPVLSSNVSSLPEVLGDAALLVNPAQAFSISRGIQHILLDEELRSTLIKRGKKQIEKFSWEEAARGMLQVYRQAVA